jgi:nucleotide-binding universal stress UspA family protein
MTWKPIVTGVDASPQAATAAAFAWRIARAAETECYFVHGSRPLFRSAAGAEFVTDVNALIEQQLEAARMGVSATIEPALPAAALRTLEIRSGRGASVVVEVARERHAGLIVLGGKHHTTLGRWMGGSTAHHVVRVTDIPLLVTGEKVGAMRRILVAADLSYAVRPTFEAAVRMARLFGAELRVLHAVEPLPVFAELPALWNEEGFVEDSKAQFERCLEPLLEEVVASPVVRRGYAAEAIAAEVAAWGADLVVVGSHGKGWVDRLLLGSTTERLLDQLPTSLLVVPVPAPTGERRPGRARRLARQAQHRVARGT